MIKRFILVAIFILSLARPAMAAGLDGSGKITGTLVNKSENGSGVAGQTVILKAYRNESEIDTQSTKSDAGGKFEFNGLITDPAYFYQVTLTYQEAEYYSDGINFKAGEVEKSAQITVYDNTDSDKDISVVMSHAIVYPEKDYLLIKEIFVFVNESDRTFIGLKADGTGGKRATLRFFLPPGAEGLKNNLGLIERRIIPTANGFLDTLPVLPGGKEISFSYRIPNKSATFTFLHRANYDTARFDFLVPSGEMNVSGDELVEEEPLNISGRLFKHFSSKDLAAGSSISARLSGIPATNQPGIPIWVWLILLAFLGAVGLVFFRRRKVKHIAHAHYLQPDKERLIAELAELDDDFEAGKIAKDVYHRLRSEKKHLLLEIMRTSGGGSVDDSK